MWAGTVTEVLVGFVMVTATVAGTVPTTTVPVVFCTNVKCWVAVTVFAGTCRFARSMLVKSDEAVTVITFESVSVGGKAVTLADGAIVMASATKASATASRTPSWT